MYGCGVRGWVRSDCGEGLGWVSGGLGLRAAGRGLMAESPGKSKFSILEGVIQIPQVCNVYVPLEHTREPPGDSPGHTAVVA